MIKIKYDRPANSVNISGHAGYAEMGKDTVCAAVSALAYTLNANVMDMGDKGMVVNAVMRMKPGDAEISCKAVPGFEEDVRKVYDSICLGFEMLSGSFKKNIEYEVVTG